MKAYMSQQQTWESSEPDYGDGPLWQSLAEREARRILAETEPSAGRIGITDAAWHGHAVTMRGTVDGRALAEALAAFLEG